MKLLIFCAHPDDEVIGMGGTIRRFADAGAQIRLVLFSAGAEGYADRAEKDRICDIRAGETDRVCRLLGISSHVNWRRQDWDIEVNNAMYRAVIEEIRAFRPDAVFTHAYGDYHDHRNVHRAVSEGWFHAPLACAMERHPVWKAVPLYEFEVISLLPHPTVTVDITAAFEVEQQAMAIYSSQAGVVGGAAQLLEGRALLRGQAIGVKYAEAFSRSTLRPRAISRVETLLD